MMEWLMKFLKKVAALEDIGDASELVLAMDT